MDNVIQPLRHGLAQTVLGPIEPIGLGVILTHEHLLFDGSLYFDEPGTLSDRTRAHEKVGLGNLSWVRYHSRENLDNMQLLDEDVAGKEASLFKLHGGGTIVDLTPIDVGRDPAALARISRATGLHIVMGTAFYVHVSSRRVLEDKTDEEIAEVFIRDIRVGDSYGIRAGVIGELGCSHPLMPTERRVLYGGAIAQRDTGAAIVVHPGRNEDDPMEVVAALADAGADLSRVVVSHMDRCGYELKTRRKLLDAGCCIAYDQFGNEGYYPARVALSDGHLPDMPNDVGRIREIRELIGLGYVDQIVLSHDIAFKFQLASYGGWGFSHLLDNVAPLMRVYGIAEEQIHAMMAQNPRRLLTLPECA